MVEEAEVLEAERSLNLAIEAEMAVLDEEWQQQEVVRQEEAELQAAAAEEERRKLEVQ